jgi:hypothetical protein
VKPLYKYNTLTKPLISIPEDFYEEKTKKTEWKGKEKKNKEETEAYHDDTAFVTSYLSKDQVLHLVDTLHVANYLSRYLILFMTPEAQTILMNY